LGEYADLYLKLDVLLLADVFESFRTKCLDVYKLDPAHYYTTPGFTWDAMLKKTGETLQLLTDIDMVLFIENGIRGGLSQVSNRYAKANNPNMGDSFNPEAPHHYLMYFDVNNLYGWAMNQCLPLREFQWVDITSKIDKYWWRVADDAPTGYILEVDLEYPEEFHDRHNDLPFCPEVKPPPGKPKPSENWPLKGVVLQCLVLYSRFETGEIVGHPGKQESLCDPLPQLETS